MDSTDLTLNDLIYHNKLKKYENTQDKINDKFNNVPKFYIIRRIPYLFIIFLIIFMIMLYFRINNNNIKSNIILDYCLELVIGMIIIISGVYIWSIRSEYNNLLDNLYIIRKELETYIENKNITELYKKNIF